MFTDASKQFHEGIELHKLGFLEEAASKYSSLIDSNSYKVYANLNLASIRFQQYRYDEAIYHYKKGLEFAPENFGAHVDLAKVYEMMGQWNKAIYHLNESLKISPNHATALRRKKRILEEKQFYESLRKKLEFETKNYKPVYTRFTVQSDYEIEEYVCESIESLMERVYLELNSEFDFQPEVPVKLILLYNKANYDDLMSFPRWAAGMYDGSIKILLRTTDKIHLGIIYVLLRHEYVHKIVEELSNGKCPRWFNEGLSEYKARKMFDFERDILQKALSKNQQIPLDELDNKFMTSRNNMRLAYIQAYSIVELIVEEIGIIGVRELLRKAKNSETKCDKAIYQVLGATPKKLQTKWLKSKRRSMLQLD